jgi:hypothetical protein
MPISFRISELEVQVGRFVYAFEECDEADGFQACVSAVNAGYCERKHPYAAKVPTAEHAKAETSDRGPSRMHGDNEGWYGVGTQRSGVAS